MACAESTTICKSKNATSSDKISAAIKLNPTDSDNAHAGDNRHGGLIIGSAGMVTANTLGELVHLFLILALIAVFVEFLERHGPS